MTKPKKASVSYLQKAKASNFAGNNKDFMN